MLSCGLIVSTKAELRIKVDEANWLPASVQRHLLEEVQYSKADFRYC